MEIDKSGQQNVPSFDCCFHPEALDYGAKSKQFRDLLVQTAFDGIEASYARNRLPTTLERKAYHVLKGVAYKSGPTIPTMMVDTVSKNKEWTPGAGKLKEREPGTHWPMPTPVPSAPRDAAAAAAPTPIAAAVTPPAQSGTKVAKGAAAKPAIKKGFLEKAISKEAAIPTIRGNAKKPASEALSGGSAGIKLPHQQDSEDLFDASQGFQQPAGKSLVQEVSAANATAKPAKGAEDSKRREDALGLKAGATTMKKRPQAPPPPAQRETVVDNSDMNSTTPRYVVSEKGNQSMVTQEFESVGKQFVTSNRPVELVYRVELPKVVKSSQVELDVQERRLVLTYLDVYRLDVNPLPYPVFEARGSAKYDKATKTLTVTLPVRPAPLLRAAVGGSVASGADAESQEEEAAADSSPTKAAAEPKKGAGKPKAEQHSKWVATADAAGGAAAVVEEVSVEGGVEGGAAPALSLAEEIRLKSQQALEEYSSKKSGTQQPQAGPAPAVAANAAPGHTAIPTTGAKDFYPSKTFAGRKPGYVFKRDEKLGLGYHRDVDPKAAADAEPSAAAVAAGVAGSVEGATGKAWCVPFAYDYRQHNHCVSVVINVAHIRPGSVKIQYAGDDTAVAVRFSARKPGETGDDRKLDELFGLSLKLPAAVDPARCKYDVAATNMVLILTKKVAATWTAQDAAGGGGSSGGLTETDAVALLTGGAGSKSGSSSDVLRCELLAVDGTASFSVCEEEPAVTPAPIELDAPLPPPPLKAATPGNTAETLEMVERNINDLSFSSNAMIFELD